MGDNFHTPPRLNNSDLKIPATPFLDCLGIGTGVNVWKLRNPTQNSPWAVKNVRNAMDMDRKNKIQSLIENEAAVLSELNHGNIVGFRGLLKSEDGRHCLAMEACGESLGDLIEKRESDPPKPFKPKEILKVVQDVAKALNYLHTEKKLLHGDIKSYNILVKGDFEAVKLCDLGVSVKLNDLGFAEEYIGTLIYNAPEVVNDILVPITGKAEIFSLGLVIWEMLALAPPHCDDMQDSMNSSFNDSEMFDDSQASILMNGCLGTRPNLPPGLGEEYKHVIDIFMACTEENPEKRPSAAELVNMVQNSS